MLSLSPSRVLVWALVQSCVSRCCCARGGLQHAVESDHRPEPPVEPQHELIEIALETLRTDAGVRTQEPRIEMSEDEVNHREMRVRLGLILRDRHGYVPGAQRVHSIVAGPSVAQYLS